MKVPQLAIFSLDDILPYIGKVSKKLTVGNEVYDVRLNSLRLLLFKRNLTCVSCQRKGTHFGLDLPKNHIRPHINLYSGDVLMTKDHIIPSSKGGPNKLSNLQTMCVLCNSAKGDKYENQLE